jgi:hypothetical protein
MANQDASVVVRQLTGAPVALSLPPSSTVAHLKKLLLRKTSVAVDTQRVRARPCPWCQIASVYVSRALGAARARRLTCRSRAATDCLFRPGARQPTAPQLLWRRCRGSGALRHAPRVEDEGHVRPPAPSVLAVRILARVEVAAGVHFADVLLARLGYWPCWRGVMYSRPAVWPACKNQRTAACSMLPPSIAHAGANLP